MSRHLQDLLADLRTRLARMTAGVQQLVELAVESALTADARLARQAMDMDTRIDDEEVKVEKQAIDLLALHQPAAGDLRLITSIIKVNNDFERIADCGVNVAQRVLPLAGLAGGPGGYAPPNELTLMGNSVLA